MIETVKYEYLVLGYYENKFGNETKFLNYYGSQGWELCAAYYPNFYFKRALAN